jgi:hypothetical protein
VIEQLERVDRPATSRFPSFFEEMGNKRLMDAGFFCEKNRKPRIRWK